MHPLLQIKDLNVKTKDNTILHGVSLSINPGEVHVVMGPNGSGKSTLAQTIAGNETYSVISGTIQLNNTEIQEEDPSMRASQGLFVSMQHPVEIPGVSTLQFLRTAINEQRKTNNQEPIPTKDFLERVKEAQQQLNFSDTMVRRGVNEGFSGGEKKKNEILQLLVLKPTLAILDEVDSGLDIDARTIIGTTLQQYASPTNALIIITHHNDILKHIEPTNVHIMNNGNIQESGGKELISKIQDHGYNQ